MRAPRAWLSASIASLAASDARFETTALASTPRPYHATRTGAASDYWESPIVRKLSAERLKSSGAWPGDSAADQHPRYREHLTCERGSCWPTIIRLFGKA